MYVSDRAAQYRSKDAKNALNQKRALVKQPKSSFLSCLLEIA
jgi:hypothetical protein